MVGTPLAASRTRRSSSRPGTKPAFLAAGLESRDPGSRIIYSAARNTVAATAIATQSRRLLAALVFSSDEAACLASLASRRTRLVPGMRTPVCFP